MPEGPEIRRAADTVARALVGKPIAAAWFAFDRLNGFSQRLCGHTVDAVDTHGKAMLIRVDNGLTIYSHNQLYGRWFVRPAGSLPRTNRSLRLALHTSAQSALLYSASDIDVLDRDQLLWHPFLSRLGPDILGADQAEMVAQLEQPRFGGRRLGVLLLDQRFLAGVGNYLRSEILFVARLSPDLRLSDLGDAQRAALISATTTLARQSYRHNGITNSLALVRELRAMGQTRSRYRHWVFARRGAPCRVCTTPIVEKPVASRRLYYCPTCQSPERRRSAHPVFDT
jgi:endonuclease-8